jgi:hypothetical protein
MSDRDSASAITFEEFNRLVFDLRDRLWEGNPPTAPDPPLRLLGWRGRAHELLSQVLDLQADEDAGHDRSAAAGMQLSVGEQEDESLALVRRELSGARRRLRKALTVAEEVDWRRDPEAVVLLRDTVLRVENVANQLAHQLEEGPAPQEP